MRRIVPWSIVAVLALALIGQQFSGAPCEAPESAPPREFVEIVGAAIAQANVEALVSLYHPDGEHRDMATGRKFQRREALKQFFNEEYAEDPRPRALETEIVSLRLLTSVVAIANLTVRYASARPETPGWPPYTAIILTKEAQTWGIAASRAGGNYGTPETGIPLAD